MVDQKLQLRVDQVVSRALPEVVPHRQETGSPEGGELPRGRMERLELERTCSRAEAVLATLCVCVDSLLLYFC